MKVVTFTPFYRIPIQSDDDELLVEQVLKKSVIAAKGQVEHTKSEREILFEVRHPYIVRLRYAFQSEDKLYLVTDYYNGGTLFYHLRKSRSEVIPIKTCCCT
jgi:serine/threonine protein kinase